MHGARGTNQKTHSLPGACWGKTGWLEKKEKGCNEFRIHKTKLHTTFGQDK